jgi:2-C-methyl-D-erythritol 4-phosphate cytidylyltransferase / 2-C-methyl-D-erythritol 2,4-cyclodiphosphate synthase
MRQETRRAGAIIVAGGQGTRAATARPKQYLPLGGRPVLRWSAEAFVHDGRFGQIIVVRAPEHDDEARAALADLPIVFADAGPTRTASVRSGLEQLSPDIDLVFIHDAARPGLKRTTLDHLFSAMEDATLDGVAPALPISDALWRSDAASGLMEPKERAALLRVQTPQVFRAQALLNAYRDLDAQSELADDLAVAHNAKLKLGWCKGDPDLDKITWGEDLARIERQLTAQLTPQFVPRIGTGFDAHRFAEGGFVTLCGVQIAHDHRLAGHSDADVAWHALADALYGALGDGDIGAHFPPSDPQWKGAPSSVFLAHAAERVRQAGGRISNVDVTLICEAPRVGPHRVAMRSATAQLLGVGVHQVSVKATTTEEMGFTGRREGIAAQATALVLLPEKGFAP